MAYVLVTSLLPGDALHRLAKEHMVRVLTKEETLSEHIKEADALICLLSDPITKELLESALHLKGISTYAVGYNNIDVETATKRGILVTNTPGVLTESSADHTFALLLACARRLIEGDTMTREGRFQGWEPSLLLGMDVYGKTLGIIGAGRIGQAVARRALGFGMKVVYHNRNPLPKEVEKELNLTLVPLNDLLQQSDFVSLHCPLTKETHHLLGSKELSLLKPTAILVNTARGLVVDEEALVLHLQEKKIFGAAFDVYEKEPALTKGLETLENVVLAPHTASATIETRLIMADMVVDATSALLKNEIPKNLLNPEALANSSRSWYTRND